jgi:ferredoxin
VSPSQQPADPAPTESLRYRLQGREVAAEYLEGETLLEAARRVGLSPPTSCEQGNCATCIARLTEGAATLRVNDALTPEELEDGWVLTCQAIPHGRHVAVDYDA